MRSPDGLRRRGRPPAVGGSTEHELYGQLLDSRRRAHQRLLTVHAIERRHRDTPLADLAALAVGGALHHLTCDREDVTL